MPQTIDAGAEGRAVVNLNRFDLAMLKPFMPETTQASGLFTGKADVARDTTKEAAAGQYHSSGRNAGDANRQRCGAARGVSDAESDGGVA